MVTFTVHEPPHPSADRVDRADELRFIKDGFSWLTAFLPPLGLAAKGLWIPLIAFLAGIGLVTWLLSAMGADPSWTGLVVTAIGLYLGFEVSTIERAMLDRAGWHMLGTVTGRNIADCERRFFETWLPDQPVITVNRTSGPSAAGSTLPFASA